MRRLEHPTTHYKYPTARAPRAGHGADPQWRGAGDVQPQRGGPPGGSHRRHRCLGRQGDLPAPATPPPASWTAAPCAGVGLDHALAGSVLYSEEVMQHVAHLPGCQAQSVRRTHFAGVRAAVWHDAQGGPLAAAAARAGGASLRVAAACLRAQARRAARRSLTCRAGPLNAAGRGACGRPAGSVTACLPAPAPRAARRPVLG